MNVTLINYTGFGHIDPLFAARLLIYTKNTRLEQGLGTRLRVQTMPEPEVMEQLAYIAGTIRSSWEFVHYTFEITGVSRAFTHQFVRTRTGSYAQQSQRSVDLSEGFETVVPPSIGEQGARRHIWNNVMATISDAYADLAHCGVPTQDCRAVLPTNVATNVIAEFNLRTLADLCGKRDNPRAQGEYTAVFKEMAKAMLEVHPWVDRFLYPERTRTPNLDAILRRLLGDGTPLANPELNAALKEVDALKEVWG